MNAREEFIDEFKGLTVECAIIEFDSYDLKKKVLLKIGYCSVDYDSFLTELNVDYDDGFGGQELYGVVWFIDGTYADRYEYDGAEHWVHRKRPVIPIELIN